ncbi:MAG: hypothetical protein HKL81_08095, partial [Acidimicrobiaceae bacterium]|nr:hypothetical protein [Acidimicrobiaceae bacterium]
AAHHNYHFDDYYLHDHLNYVGRVVVDVGWRKHNDNVFNIARRLNHFYDAEQLSHDLDNVTELRGLSGHIFPNYPKQGDS